MHAGPTRSILITGGAGFIGSNLAERFLANPGTRIRIFDDLSRKGVAHNLRWLRESPAGNRVEFVEGDIRDARSVVQATEGVDEIYHLAAQVAVTSSVDAPRTDFEVNALGTFNVLEAARRSGRRPFLLFTSTNKVYGGLESVPVEQASTRYRASDPGFTGVAESEKLDFHSPYGCSKGAADQYVRDYARIYDLPTVVFRMSCIAGPRQFGNEDQGWVAHFLYSVLERRPITIYGDGLQVRDILHVGDLLDAIEAAREHAPRTTGEIYNIGGGPEHAISVVEMLRLIELKTGIAPILRHAEVRPGDQPLYVSDTTKMGKHTGWCARHSCESTLDAIHTFWRNNRGLLAGERQQVQISEAADTLEREVVA